MSRPPYRPFTPADDEAILRLRAAGKTWRAIAEVTGQWHVSCQRRHEVLLRSGENALPTREGISTSGPNAVSPCDRVVPDPVRLPRRNGEALPAGHPVTWGAIALEGYQFD